MTDREKVIKGLECHSDPVYGCDACPYSATDGDEDCGWLELCKDALALLKEQEAPKTTLRQHGGTIEIITEPIVKHGEWISVEDRLPKDDEDVLAYLDCGEESRITACNYSHGVWYDCVMNDIVIVARNITHWMPLPEPPKEEYDGN